MSVLMLNNFPVDCPFNEKGPYISLYLKTNNFPKESKKLVTHIKDKMVTDYNSIEIEKFIEPLNQLERDSKLD